MSNAQKLKDLVQEIAKGRIELDEKLTKAEQDIRQVRQEEKEQQNRQS